MSPPPPPNDVVSSTTPPASPSKLVHALNKSEATQQHQQKKQQTMMSSSKSTPFQPHRRIRTTSFGVGPTPTRAPSMTIHQRRRTASGAGHLNNSITINNNKPDVQLLPRLEEENANLPPQDSIDFILAQIEKQNALLDEDPKSVCIQSNELKAHLSTMQNLVSEQQEATTTNNDQDNDIDWEFWTALTEDFGAVALKLPHLLSAKLKAGIPDKVRGVIWQAMTSSASLNLETLYGQLVVEHSPYERIIQRDLARTFPNVDMFKQEGGDGQQKLMRVLKAYSLYDVHVGYCQGLAFLVGPLLMNMPEQQAFCVFVRLMETYEMRTMFTLNMEGLQLRLYQFSSLLSQILPELSDHLADHAVHPPMYASQWFLTLFAYAFPIPLVMRIYDIIFAEGAAETIMRVAIAMLKHSQDELLAMNEFEDILDHVTSKLHLAYTTVTNTNNENGEENEINNDHNNKKNNMSDPGCLQIINEAMELSGLITREKMDHLADLYVRELEQEKKQTEQVLAVRFNFWSKDKDKKNNSSSNNKKRESGGWLSKRSSTSSGDESPEKQPSTPVSTTPTIATTVSSSSTSVQPQQDVATLHQQIEDLLLALSQIQKDHIQLKQELVQVRMDKMDVEAERDAMKMTLLDMEEQQEDQGPATEFSKMMSTTIQQQKQQLKLQQEHQENTIRTMQNELDRVQSSHFELQQQNEELRHQNEMAKQAQEGLIEKLVNMKNKMEQLESDHIKVVKERDSLKRQQAPMEQKLKDAEKTAHELQFEKLRLLDDLESMKEQRDQLNTPPQTPTPTSTIGRRSSLMMTRNKSSSGVPTTTSTTGSEATRKPRPRSVFVSSAETRCLELEQLLADAKLQIAELETFGPTSTSTSTASKKSISNKRRSFDPIALSRAATSQGLSSNVTNKRSSFYGRLWSSVTTTNNSAAQQQDTPPTSPI
ncbi:rab-GTPase-TBC domain-containing protein [Phascolomyces articulosus]|uniref:Rab-GTPase-TBC domain-containing protein n=1 Tax=Phascolomyces articulosus TaxID=60185 RepID=A0AAD5JRF9_9FUNG|nr:rab-GTPase-TBC domain-containing protein [Phascolomyces articulosus]